MIVKSIIPGIGPSYGEIASLSDKPEDAAHAKPPKSYPHTRGAIRIS